MNRTMKRRRFWCTAATLTAACGVAEVGGLNTSTAEDECSLALGVSCDQFSEAFIKSSDTDRGDFFGYSIALDATTLAVGAIGEDSAGDGINAASSNDLDFQNSGAVYVFTRSGAEWRQEAYLKASNPGASDQFGNSISLYQDTIAVGAFREDSAATGIDGEQNNEEASSSGAVYIFTRLGRTWRQEAYLKASNSHIGQEFGTSLELDGDTLAVGAPQESSAATGVGGDQSPNLASGSGAVYVFTRSAGAWEQEAYLKASNTGPSDRFGQSIGLHGSILAVGAPAERSSAVGVDGDQGSDEAPGSGAVYVFRRSGSTWAQEAYLKASNADEGDSFGSSLALSGATLAVGAPSEGSSAAGVGGNQFDESSRSSGAVYVFARDSTTWNQQVYLKASNPDPGDRFGASVALHEDTLAVAAVGEDGATSGVDGDEAANEAVQSGAVYLFTRSSTTWRQDAYVKASNTGALDEFGFSVDIDAGTLAVGAPKEDSTASGVNGDQANNESLESGAVYVRRIGTDQ